MEEVRNRPTSPIAMVELIQRGLAIKSQWEGTYGPTITHKEVAELAYLSFPERQRYLNYPDYKLIELIFVEHLEQRQRIQAKAA